MNIKMLICDVDGTLTDNKATYDNNGICSKSFSVLDGMGFGLLKQANIEIAWVTGSSEPCIKYRAYHCGIKNIFMGVQNKDRFIEKTLILPGTDINWNTIAYIGDDINDLDCIRKAAFSAVPADAIIKEFGIHHYTCSKSGGNGAVREFIDQIIKVSIHKNW